MKRSCMNIFKETLMVGLMAGTIISTTAFGQTGTLGMIAGGVAQTAAGTAASTISPYAGIALGALGAVISFVKPPEYYVSIGTPHVPAINIDPAQLTAEYMVLNSMKDVTTKWKPKPQDEYQKAAKSNGAGNKGSPGGTKYDSMFQKLPFQAAALKNVGIEAVGVGTLVTEIVTDETREKILEDLEWLQSKSNASSTTEDSDEIPGAGSCAAKYSVCSKYDSMTSEERDQVAIRQIQNEQNYGTAGIAHAELGLKSVQQAMEDDESSSLSEDERDKTRKKLIAVATNGEANKIAVQDLSTIIGTGVNTVAAMKIVAMMNLELAQRLNQGNMLQGSVLTIEAARAIPDTAELTD